MQTYGRDTLDKSKVTLSHNTMAVVCQQPAHHDEVLQWFHNIELLELLRGTLVGRWRSEVLQYMFLKQSHTSLRNIVPEHLIQKSHVILKLDGIASFIKRIEASDERNRELIISRTLIFDKYVERQEWSRMSCLGHSYIYLWIMFCWCSLPHMLYKLPYV